MKKTGLLGFLLMILVVGANAQKKVVDRIAAVVGDNIILQSDIEGQYAQYLTQGNPPNENVKCEILQQLLTQKLLVKQAVIDSVKVEESDIDSEVDRRMRYSISRAGGQERLEEFLGRSVIQYKDEIRPDIKEQLVAQKMQAKITEKVSVTPTEVEEFYKKIPTDSLPQYNKEVEVGQIIVYPQLNKEEKEASKDK